MEPDGEPRGREATGGADRGQAGKARWQGEDVSEVHFERIARLFSEGEGRGRSRRRAHQVTALERGVVVAADQCANALRLEIEGVVVTCRERESPEHDPSANLRAKALRSCLGVRLGEICTRNTKAVANPVEPCEVARRLGGRDEIVDRHRVLGVGKRYVDQGCALFFESAQSGLDSRANVGILKPIEQVANHADPQSLDAMVARSDVVSRLPVGRSRVTPIVAGDHLEQLRRLPNRARHRSDLVERRRKCDESVSGHPAIRRLDGGNPTKRSGLSHRAARITAERQGRQARSGCTRGAARGAARSAVQSPRVVHVRERRVLVGRPHGELVEIRLPEDHGARGAQGLDYVRVVGRDVVAEDLRRTGRANAPRTEVVFEGDGHTRQRAELLARISRAVDLRRRGERALVIDGEEAR